MKDLIATLRPAFVSMLLFTLILGVGYPLLVGGVGELAFSAQAKGSLVRDAAGRVVGSALVGQAFDNPAYFWSRPTATRYDAMTSSGVNAGATAFLDKAGTLGPNAVLVDAVEARMQALRDADPQNTSPVPIDLVTASSSGLDPHISPAAAYYQLARVARTRGVTDAQLRSLVDAQIEERTWGLLGERRVNVLLLNRVVDATLGVPRP